MGAKNFEAPTNEFFTTEELQETLRWYIELPDDISVDTNVVLHIAEVINQREQAEHPESVPNVEDALADFKKRLSELGENGNVVDTSSYQPTRTAAPYKPHRSNRRTLRTLSKVACTAAAVVMLFFSCIGIANAAGYDAWNRVASWTEDIFTFRDRGGKLEVSAPVSHEPDGSGSYASLQDALDAFGITASIAPKWIPRGYNAESITATRTDSGAFISALYVLDSEAPDSTAGGGIYLDISFDELDTEVYRIPKDTDDAEEYEVKDISHYIITNAGDVVAMWQQGSCRCAIGSNSLSTKDLKEVIDSIYWRR